MGAFTQLGESEVGEIVDAFGLGTQLLGFDPIAAGTINSNYVVTTDRARHFVRVNEGKAEVDVAWEARLVTALAEHAFPTPAPRLARDGRPYAPLVVEGTRKWVSVFPWRAGRHLAAGDVTPERAATLGKALAQLHAIGLELPPAWRRGSIYDEEHLAARFERITTVIDRELAHAVELLGVELAEIRAARELRAKATTGLIHGDLFRDNVLWDGETIVGVLDFEQASGGSLAYDLAVAINDWCWFEDRMRVDRIAALIDGYRSVRPLSPGDVKALPIEVRLAAARFTITRITDVYLARVDNPEKDFRAFLARVEAWQGPALGALSAVL